MKRTTLKSVRASVRAFTPGSGQVVSRAFAKETCNYGQSASCPPDCPKAKPRTLSRVYLIYAGVQVAVRGLGMEKKKPTREAIKAVREALKVALPAGRP